MTRFIKTIPTNARNEILGINLYISLISMNRKGIENIIKEEVILEKYFNYFSFL